MVLAEGWDERVQEAAACIERLEMATVVVVSREIEDTRCAAVAEVLVARKLHDNLCRNASMSELRDEGPPTAVARCAVDPGSAI